MSFVEGTVMEIIYRNDENGYTVLELDCDGSLVVCVGTIPLIQPGEYVRFYGAYTTHKNYGEQFKVASMESKMPEGDESIKLFLSGGLIKGIGEVLAHRIVQEFHKDTFNIIENHPEELAKIKGISRPAAERIQQQFKEVSSIRGVVIELQKLGLTIREAMLAYEAYGQSAPYLIEKNPYRLMDDIRGIGFEKADRIAAGMGMENYGDLRLYNGIRHVLKLKMEGGHTCLPLEMLVKTAASMLQESEERTRAMLTQLIAQGVISENLYNGTQAVATADAYAAESFDAYKLMQLCKATPKNEISLALAEKVLMTDKQLSEEQERAVLMALQNSVAVITGGPGTGKTTILNQIITILEKSGITAVLAAPTGRAAKRMEKATLREAKTIHRLLEYGVTPGEEINEFCRFNRDEENPIEAEAIIIDEMSMVDIFLFRSLLAAVAPGTRLILTGDADQLPSVGPGNVLKDIIASGKVPVAVLTEVFRQQGNIALNASRVNRGEAIDLFPMGDFVFLPASGPEDTLRQTVSVFLERLKDGYSLDDVQIICPVKKGEIGVYNINKTLREVLNPRLVGKEEFTFGDTTYRVGDKVMQTTNNYSKEWYIKGTVKMLSRGTGAYNGDLGRIEAIDTEEKTVDILFDGERMATYEWNEMDQLEHAYAVTVHKSQGSEFNTVILPLYYGGNDFLTRNLLYTAITRAKEKMIVIGSARTVQFMVHNSRISHRFTALKYELKSCGDFMDNVGRGQESLQQEYEKLLGIFDED